MKAKLINSIETGLSSSDVWTIISYGDTDISRVYIKKQEAEEAVNKKNQELYDYARQTNKRMTDEEFDKHYNDKKNYIRRKYEVKSLYDAIDWIKDAAIDNATYNDGD
ncbi:MAG: hypothetical protein WC554_09920 [Clostridia bacterium]